jgi:bacterioferritin
MPRVEPRRRSLNAIALSWFGLNGNDGFHRDPARDATVMLLNEALAIQVACASSYRRHHLIADSMDKSESAARFLGYARDENVHSNWLAQRIVQLGGKPGALPKASAQSILVIFGEAPSVASMIAANAASERAVIDSYCRILTHVGNSDLITRSLIEDALATALQRAQACKNWHDK